MLETKTSYLEWLKEQRVYKKSRTSVGNVLSTATAPLRTLTQINPNI